MNMAPPSLHWRGSRVKSLAAAVLLVLAAAHVQPALMAQTPAPVIEKLKPALGPVGTNVKIKGSNFGTSPGTVTFNGTNAPVNPDSNWESDKIQVIVPEGATTGPVVVTVGTQSSAGVTFTVTSAPSRPVIEKLKPALGPVGTNVKIKGSNFGTSPGTVTFNGTNAPVNPDSNWESAKIQVKVPEGATTGSVVVTTAGGKSSAGVSFTVTIPAPVISSLDPSSGPVNTQVTIDGANFGSSGTVTFNGTTASTTSWDTDEIETSVPSGATTGPVVVTTSGGQSSTGVTFTVTVPAPVNLPAGPQLGHR